MCQTIHLKDLSLKKLMLSLPSDDNSHQEQERTSIQESMLKEFQIAKIYSDDKIKLAQNSIDLVRKIFKKA